MVKLFVGNIPSDCARVDIVELFEKYGKVKDCDIIRNFAFIHMDDDGEAKEAIEALNKTKFMGVEITVEESSSRPRNTHKIYVGNISSSASRRELQKLFEEHGEVTACDIIKDFAFVHMSKEREAENAIKDLDGMTFGGRTVKVEFARTNPRQGHYGPPGGGYRDYQYDRWNDYHYGRGGMGGYRGGYGGGRYNNYYRSNYGGYGGRGGGGGYYRRRSPDRRRRSRSRSRSDSRSRSRSRSPGDERKSYSRSRSRSHSSNRRSETPDEK